APRSLRSIGGAAECSRIKGAGLRGSRVAGSHGSRDSQLFSKLGRTQSRLRARIERPFGLSGVVAFGKERFAWRIVTPFLAPLSQRTSVSNRRKGNSINSSLGAKPHVARS